MAVQLAAASGVKIVTVASIRNHDIVKALGAGIVIDYKSPRVVDDVVAALQSGGENFAGAYDAISEPESYLKVGEVLQKLGGGVTKVVNVLPPQSPPDGFQPSLVFATDILRETNADIAEGVWVKFLPEALSSGQIKVFPEPEIVGQGLETIQGGIEKLKGGGVSAKKLVVKL